MKVRNSFCDICAPGPHCAVSCYVENEKIVKIEGADHPCNGGLLCTRGQGNRQYVYRKDRIKTPLKRVGDKGEGRFEPISWDQAFEIASKQLLKIREESGAESVAFYSGYEKWYRPFLQRLAYAFGSPNYGTESSACHMATAMSWKLATGYEVVKNDLSQAGLYLGWCCNVFNSAHLMGRKLMAERERGLKVIIIDPRITTAVDLLADLHLRPKPGTDGALAHAIGRELIMHGWIDEAFIKEHVHGFDEYKAYVMAFTPEKGEEITGVSADDIRLCAKMMHENGPVTISQSGASHVHHYNGMQNHRAVMALIALLGAFDREGGILPDQMTYAHSMGGFETLEPEFGMEIFPKDTRPVIGSLKYPLWYDLIGEMQSTELSHQILTEDPYPIRAVWAHGMNYRIFNGSRHLKEALKKLDFFVDIDLFMTDTAKLADLVLPACSSFEREEFKVWPGGWCQYTEPVIPRMYESYSDTEIIFRLSEALSLSDPYLRSDYETCVKYMIRNTKISIDNLKKDRQHPHKVPDFVPVPIGRDVYKTPTGKFELLSTVMEKKQYKDLDALPTWRENPLEQDFKSYPFFLVAGGRIPHALHSRLHDVDMLRGFRREPMAEISREDAAEMELTTGDWVILATREGSLRVKVLVNGRIMKGQVFMYHGYREADVNSIIPWEANDPYSGFPVYRSCRCSMEKETLT